MTILMVKAKQTLPIKHRLHIFIGGETAANRSCTPSGKYVVKRCKKLLARQVSIQNPLRQSRFSDVPMTAMSYSAATQLRRCPAMPSKPDIIKGDLLYRPGLCKFIIACSMTRTVKGSHRNTVKNITLEHSHFWIALTHSKSYRSYITSDHSQQTRHQIYWQAQHFGRLAPSSKAMPLPNNDANERFSPYIITSTVMALTRLWPWNSLWSTTLPFRVYLGGNILLTSSFQWLSKVGTTHSTPKGSSSSFFGHPFVTPAIQGFLRGTFFSFLSLYLCSQQPFRVIWGRGGFHNQPFRVYLGGIILLTSSLPLSRSEKDSARGPSTMESEEGNPGKQHGKTRQRTKERSKPTPRNPQGGRTAKAWTPPSFLVVHDDDDSWWWWWWWWWWCDIYISTNM